MKKNQRAEKYRRPELLLTELIRQSARGELWTKNEHVPMFYRAQVVAVDVYGGKLENEDAQGTFSYVIDGKEEQVKAKKGPSNPKNSVKARIITDGADQFLNDDELKVFWPLTQEHDSIPIKPGEHVYVTFEDSNFVHGLWIGKIPGHSNLNYAKGDSFYSSDQASLFSKFDDSKQTVENDKKFEDNDVLASGRKVGKNLSKLFNDQ